MIMATREYVEPRNIEDNGVKNIRGPVKVPAFTVFKI